MLYPIALSVLVATLAAAPALGAFPPNAAYYGCNTYSTGNTIISPTPFTGGLQGCIAACVTQSGAGGVSQTAGLRFTLWNPLAQRCACNHMGQWPAYNAVADPSLCGTTNTNDYQGYYTKTTFTSISCSSTQTLDPRDVTAKAASSKSVEPQHCTSLCATYKYMILHPNKATWYGAYYDCQCANYPPLDAPVAVCPVEPYFLYSHPEAAQASALPRKRAELRALELQRLMQANPYCPIGYDACNVSNDASDGYECLETKDELESCGGCRFGHYANNSIPATGIDCTTLPGVNPRSVACVDGSCVAARCTRGYTLVEGICV